MPQKSQNTLNQLCLKNTVTNCNSLMILLLIRNNNQINRIQTILHKNIQKNITN